MDTLNRKNNAAEREANVKRLQQTVQNATVAAMGDKDAWSKFMKFAARMHEHTFIEQMSIYAQRPGAQEVHSFNEWSAMDANVRRGSKSIPMLTMGQFGFQTHYVFDRQDVWGRDGVKPSTERPNPLRMEDGIQAKVADSFRSLKENEGVNFQGAETLIQSVMRALEHHARQRLEPLSDSQKQFVMESATHGVMSRHIPMLEHGFTDVQMQHASEEPRSAQRLAVQSVYMSNQILNMLDKAYDQVMVQEAQNMKGAEQNGQSATGADVLGGREGSSVPSLGDDTGRDRGTGAGTTAGGVRASGNDVPAHTEPDGTGVHHGDTGDRAVSGARSESTVGVPGDTGRGQGDVEPAQNGQRGEAGDVRADGRDGGHEHLHQQIPSGQYPQGLTQYGFFVDKDMQISLANDAAIYVNPQGKSLQVVRSETEVKIERGMKVGETVAINTDGVQLNVAKGRKGVERGELEPAFHMASNEAGRMQEFVGMSMRDFVGEASKALQQSAQPAQVQQQFEGAAMEIG